LTSIARNEIRPIISRTAGVASTAMLVGNVRVESGAFIDHGVIVESAGPPITVGADAIVLAGAIVRSVGGATRPAFPVSIGRGTLVGPQCVLTGCSIGMNCYVATGAIALLGAVIGDHARIGVGAIIHAGAEVPALGRVGMRQMAVPEEHRTTITADVARARRALAGSGFFDRAFGLVEQDQATLHERVMAALVEEVRGWHDLPVGSAAR
jgi:carbonic anhydrase/acetyltransferase-like protein (isoleucine patch superfamily)